MCWLWIALLALAFLCARFMPENGSRLALSAAEAFESNARRMAMTGANIGDEQSDTRGQTKKLPAETRRVPAQLQEIEATRRSGRRAAIAKEQRLSC